MKKLSAVVILVLFTSCNSTPSESFSQEEIKKIRNAYVSGWLSGDSKTVLGLFHEDATIVPSGMEPIIGLDAIENYWFPNDSSVTTIHSYKIELIDLDGTDSMAYTLEKGELSFTYTKGDFTMSKTSISHATTVYKLQNDQWKIISRMWTQLK